MSDPVTNVEIEDVLASIRRLVSSEARASESAGAPTRAAPQDSAEKLVLTPAQRIDETAAPAEGEALEGEAAEVDIEMPQPDVTEARSREAEDAEVIAEDGAGAERDEPDPEVPEFLRRRTFDADIADAAREGAAEQTAAAQGEAGPGDAGSGEEGPAAAANHAPESAPEASGAEPAPAEGEAAQCEAAEVEIEISDPDVDMAELEARVAEFEAAVAEQQDEWEPDGTSADDANAAARTETLAWQDVEEEDGGEQPAEAGPVEPAPETEPAPDPAPEATGSAQDSGELWLADDAVLDEDALRDMVAEIVRQELQGALGERITRNVRKLVRREIHRALLSQGLD